MSTSPPQPPAAGELLADAHAVLVNPRVVVSVKEAIRQQGHIVYDDHRFTLLGFENVVVWGTPDQDGYIVLVAGES